MLKSTPRIFVDVDGIGTEGLRTAVAAVAASVESVDPPVCVFAWSSVVVEPFGSELLDMAVIVIVPEIATLEKLFRKSSPHFSGGTCTTANHNQPINRGPENHPGR